LKNNRWRIPKSRYDSVSTYISEDSRLRPEYNDLDLVVDEGIKKRLIDNGAPAVWTRVIQIADNLIGMDERLSTHFAHLFIRDPLVIFQETLDEPPEGKSDHFEVICTSITPNNVGC
jgi:glutamate--cysteine ligase catalytic subunit